MNSLKANNLESKRIPISVSIVFSFRNEEDVLPELIHRTQNVLKKEIAIGNVTHYELMFVNDASTDKSLEVLKEESQRDKNIRIINMSRRFGVSPCVLAGMTYALSDVVVYMDADLQDPPEVIHELLECWHKNGNLDVIHTIRKSRKGETKIKLLLTMIGYTLINKFSKIHIPVEAGDFKLLSRRAVNQLIQFKEKRPYIRGLTCWIGFNQTSISYERQARFAGKTKFKITSWDVINNFFGSALISFSSAPLKIAAFLGTMALLFDFILITHVLIEKFNNRAIPGWTAIMIAVLFLGGVQLFCMGIIGVYLNSVYEESQKRPNYIIDSTINIPNKE